jgi:hypothetical protein
MSLVLDAADLKQGRKAAEAAMARLHAARLDCQIPFRDLSAYERGNAGIRYAYTFDSGKPGPHVLITGLSHGNEPGGRESVTTLIDRAIVPLRGKLSLALLNIDAYYASNGVDPYGTRFVETDFNRVWDPAILDSDKDTVELRRAREVRPLVDSADVLLDIHATPYDAVLRAEAGVARHRSGQSARHPAHAYPFRAGQCAQPDHHQLPPVRCA